MGHTSSDGKSNKELLHLVQWKLVESQFHLQCSSQVEVDSWMAVPGALLSSMSHSWKHVLELLQPACCEENLACLGGNPTWKVFINGESQKNRWFIVENPSINIINGWFGGTPILGNHQKCCGNWPRICTYLSHVGHLRLLELDVQLFEDSGCRWQWGSQGATKSSFPATWLGRIGPNTAWWFNTS